MRQTSFTTITPLPLCVTRKTVMEMLHSHTEMIDLNPLVEERHPILPPSSATAEEYNCTWYSLTDRIQYLPGGIMSGRVSYNVCFHNMVDGVQTRCYAPLGLMIKNKWTLCGSLPGEPPAPVEIGVGAPLSGLYIKEEVTMTCNFMALSFVKKTLKKAHAILVERLVAKAQFTTSLCRNVYTDCDSASIQSESESIEFGRDGQITNDSSPEPDLYNAKAHHILQALPRVLSTSEEPEIYFSQPSPGLFSPITSRNSSPRNKRASSFASVSPINLWKKLDPRARSPTLAPTTPTYHKPSFGLKTQDALSSNKRPQSQWEWGQMVEKKRIEAFRRDSLRLQEICNLPDPAPVELEGSTPV